MGDAVNPWGVLPREPKGDPSPTAIYHSVGRALSTWESVEEALANIYATILNTHSEAAMAAYGTIASGPGRIEMIKAAAAVERVLIHDALWDDLLKLLKDATRFLGPKDDDDDGVYLVPPNYNTRRRKSPRLLLDVSNLPFDQYRYVYTAA